MTKIEWVGGEALRHLKRWLCRGVCVCVSDPLSATWRFFLRLGSTYRRQVVRLSFPSTLYIEAIAKWLVHVDGWFFSTMDFALKTA
jgi:hypothetical protein